MKRLVVFLTLVAGSSTLLTAGQSLGVLEAMKMEVALVAPSDGVVRVRAAAGEQVAARQVLFEIEATPDEKEASDV